VRLSSLLIHYCVAVLAAAVGLFRASASLRQRRGQDLFSLGCSQRRNGARRCASASRCQVDALVDTYSCLSCKLFLCIVRPTYCMCCIVVLQFFVYYYNLAILGVIAVLWLSHTDDQRG